MIILNSFISAKIRKYISQRNWRKKNRHNLTTSRTLFKQNLVTVGKHSYGSLWVQNFGSSNESLKIGNYCSIGDDVKFILGGNHSINTFSSFPFKYYFNNQECEAISKGPIILEDDVWIGTNTIILSGVILGKGTIVGAGSVVTKSTKPYSIIGGNPAKLLRMRFDETIINSLMDFDFENINEAKIKSLLNLMYQPLNEKIIESLKQQLLVSNQVKIK